MNHCTHGLWPTPAVTSALFAAESRGFRPARASAALVASASTLFLSAMIAFDTGACFSSSSPAAAAERLVTVPPQRPFTTLTDPFAAVGVAPFSCGEGEDVAVVLGVKQMVFSVEAGKQGAHAHTRQCADQYWFENDVITVLLRDTHCTHFY